MDEKVRRIFEKCLKELKEMSKDEFREREEKTGVEKYYKSSKDKCDIRFW